MAKTTVEILNSGLVKIAEVRSLVPLDGRGTVLAYSKEMSDFGKCRFRVAINDPVFTAHGDIFVPHAFHVNIRRGSKLVWAGAIVNNPKRTKDYVEVEAYEYEYYLDKILVRRTSLNPVSNAADGVFRIFNSGTMAAAVSSLITDAAVDFGESHILNGLAIGSIENPNYPAGLRDANGVTLSGAFNFSTTVQLQYDFRTLFYVLRSFAAYTSFDFQVDENLRLNFKKFIGNKQNSMVFSFGTRRNIVDYDLPRLGRRMVTQLWGLATDGNGKLFAKSQLSANAGTYGMLEDATAFADVINPDFLLTRLREELQFVDSPDNAPINVVVDEKGYPLGQYDIGDIVHIRIKDGLINFDQARRIIGISVSLHDTGRELTTVQTNTPRQEDLVGT